MSTNLDTSAERVCPPGGRSCLYSTCCKQSVLAHRQGVVFIVLFIDDGTLQECNFNGTYHHCCCLLSLFIIVPSLNLVYNYYLQVCRLLWAVVVRRCCFLFKILSSAINDGLVERIEMSVSDGCLWRRCWEATIPPLRVESIDKIS